MLVSSKSYYLTRSNSIIWADAAETRELSKLQVLYSVPIFFIKSQNTGGAKGRSISNWRTNQQQIRSFSLRCPPTTRRVPPCPRGYQHPTAAVWKQYLERQKKTAQTQRMWSLTFIFCRWTPKTPHSSRRHSSDLQPWSLLVIRLHGQARPGCRDRTDQSAGTRHCLAGTEIAVLSILQSTPSVIKQAFHSTEDDR